MRKSRLYFATFALLTGCAAVAGFEDLKFEPSSNGVDGGGPIVDGGVEASTSPPDAGGPDTAVVPVRCQMTPNTVFCDDFERGTFSPVWTEPTRVSATPNIRASSSASVETNRVFSVESIPNGGSLQDAILAHQLEKPITVTPSSGAILSFDFQVLRHPNVDETGTRGWQIAFVEDGSNPRIEVSIGSKSDGGLTAFFQYNAEYIFLQTKVLYRVSVQVLQDSAKLTVFQGETEIGQVKWMLPNAFATIRSVRLGYTSGGHNAVAEQEIDNVRLEKE